MIWDDLLWIKLILKGVQCGEDVLQCIEYGVDAVMLSNHGGRQLAYARSGIEVVVEVMDILDKYNVRK